MPEVAQYSFSNREVGIALLKQADIRTGKWSFGVSFGINIGNFGADENEVFPSVMAQAQGFVLQRVPDEAPDAGLIIDASKI